LSSSSLSATTAEVAIATEEMPIPPEVAVMGVTYDPAPGGYSFQARDLAREASTDKEKDKEDEKKDEEEEELFLGDDRAGLYYAGDFVCRSASVPPGVEAACLSAAAAARQISKALLVEG
jgi:hypothetical protein